MVKPKTNKKYKFRLCLNPYYPDVNCIISDIFGLINFKSPCTKNYIKISDKDKEAIKELYYHVYCGNVFVIGEFPLQKKISDERIQFLDNISKNCNPSYEFSDIDIKKEYDKFIKYLRKEE